MNAKPQYQLSATDLAVLLALVRCGTLAEAGDRLSMDASTVFRHLQRMERGLGQALFDRSRQGYQALDLALTLAVQAERVESALEEARSSAQLQPDAVTGCVRITTTDTILHGLVAPALKALNKQHPSLRYDLHTGNELASLTRRDADIAVRATKRPPQHLVGKRIGSIQVALYAAKRAPIKQYDEAWLAQAQWVAPGMIFSSVGKPRPRKERLASASSAPASSSVTWTMTGCTVFGRTWRQRIWPVGAPKQRALST